MKKLIRFTVFVLLACQSTSFANDKPSLVRVDGSLNREAAQKALEHTALARVIMVKALPKDRKGGTLPTGTYFFQEGGEDFLRRYLVYRRKSPEGTAAQWLDHVSSSMREGFQIKKATFWTEDELRQDYERIEKGGDPHGVHAHVERVWPPDGNKESGILLTKEYWEAEITLLVADGDNALAVTSETVGPADGSGQRYGFLQFRRQSSANGLKKWTITGQGAPLTRRNDYIDLFLARFPEAVLVAGELPEHMVPKPIRLN